ncbi:MAG TPA: dockerin type I domain-containing protein [Pirellulales bacterium]|jgi:hypothetical protein
MRCLSTFVALLVLSTHPARAVILGTGDGLENTTAPANDPGFENVGILGSGSAVYLGNGWVLTAAHVYNGSSGVPTESWFNGLPYQNVPGSGVQLTNPAGVGYTQYTDLELYRLAGAPPLPSVTISNTVASAGWDVTMIGNGLDPRNSQTAYWDSSWMPATGSATYAGEIWSTTHDIRWGTNVIDQGSIAQGIGVNSEMAFMTSFTQNGTAYEAQGTPGDSGGGVFHQDPTTGAWSLAGIMFGVTSLTGQPWGISAFGDLTWSADLSSYRTEIYQTMAIPGDVNFDGVVNAQDLALVASNWLKAGTGANDPAGDANHDGIVNGQDIALVSSAIGSALGGVPAAVSVPEPSSYVLALLSLIGLLAYKRRRSA